MNSLNNKNYTLNGISYTIDEIKADDQLKKQYVKIIKSEYNKEKTKHRMRELRQDDTYNEQVRLKLKKRYEDDPVYRAYQLAKGREYRMRDAQLNNKILRTGRGRPAKYTISEDLECIPIC